MSINLEEFRKHVLDGKTVKELQDIYSCSRTKITDFKRENGLVGLSPNSKKRDLTLGHKQCPSCNEIKSLAEFYSNGYTNAGVVKYKPTCILCENVSRKDGFVKLISEYLAISNIPYSCCRCGYTGVYGSLDFHHRNPSEKAFNIGDGRNLTITLDRFMDEIAPEIDKCDLLCPNCHRQEHLVMGSKGFDRAMSTGMDNSVRYKPCTRSTSLIFGQNRSKTK